MKEREHNQRGMAAVEFALILPIFLLLLFGIVEFGVAFYKQQIITSAVREAARAGITATDPRPSSSEIEAAARQFLNDAGLDGSSATVAVSGAGGDSGSPLTVQVEYPTAFSFLSKWLAEDGVIPSVMQLEAQIVLELE